VQIGLDQRNFKVLHGLWISPAKKRNEPEFV
jgi:hypothetical protein